MYLDIYNRELEKILIMNLMKNIGVNNSVIENIIKKDEFLNAYGKSI
jgi:hypothetical protein